MPEVKFTPRQERKLKRLLAASNAGGVVSDGDKGDLVVSSSGNTWVIDNNVVTNAKLSNMAEGTIKGRASGSGAGSPQDLTATQARTIMDLGLTITLGPYYINDLPATNTTTATSGFFNTATAVSRSGRPFYMPRAGRVVGLLIQSDAARTAGTAIARVRITGVGTVFNSDSVVLDATNTATNSGFVSYADGVPFSAGDNVSCEVVSSSWAPTSANINLYVIVTLEPF